MNRSASDAERIQALSSLIENKEIMPFPRPPSSTPPPPPVYAPYTGNSTRRVSPATTGTSIGTYNDESYYSGVDNAIAEYPFSPSDVRRLSSQTPLGQAPGLLQSPPPPSEAGDDTISLADRIVTPSPWKDEYAPITDRLPNIAEGAATGFTAGRASGTVLQWQQQYVQQPNQEQQNQQRQHEQPPMWTNDQPVVAAVTPQKKKRTSRFFSKIRKDRPAPAALSNPPVPTAAFSSLPVDNDRRQNGGGSGVSAPPTPPGCAPTAQDQENGQALLIKVTAADVHDTTDLLRQLYRTELKIHDDLYDLDVDGEAERQANHERVAMLRQEITQRVDLWMRSRGSDWSPEELQHVQYSRDNVIKLQNMGGTETGLGQRL